MKIIPVIHHLSPALTQTQADYVACNMCYGLFLISMTGDNDDLPMLAKSIKARYPNLKVGINLLGKSAMEAVDHSMTFGLDMTWSDNPIVTSDIIYDEAYKISASIKDTNHMFFNSVAFKYQVKEINPGKAAKTSEDLGFIPTTSGKATGKAADIEQLSDMKKQLSKSCLGLASGLTPQNVRQYTPYIEYGLVATGISKNLHEIDTKLLKQLIENCHD